MTNLCELPTEYRTLIVKELGNYSTIIDGNGNIEVRLDEDQKRYVARKINMAPLEGEHRRDVQRRGSGEKIRTDRIQE